MSNDEFLNPYHFVPVEKSAIAEDWRTNAGAFREKGPDAGDSHASYAPASGSEPRWSGRIICRLITETPMVIGGEQKKRTGENYTQVQPFLFNGKPAIPATTLKGLVSSIAEAASGSALRVLHDLKPLSYRKPIGEALHALGIVESDANSPTGLSVRPLTLPLLQRDETTGAITIGRNAKLWRQTFASYSNLKIYIDDGQIPNRNADESNQASATDPTARHSRESGSFFYMKAHAGDGIDNFLKNVSEWPYWRRHARGRFVFGQKASRPTSPDRQLLPSEILSQSEFDARFQPEDFIRGFIRILGAEGRVLPNTKKHELFIPYPEGIETNTSLLPIERRALANFDALAYQRANAENIDKDTGQPKPPRKRHPYLPFDTPEAEVASWKAHKDGTLVPRIKAGDVVYFDVDGDKDTQEPLVWAISFSSIWRGAVPNGKGFAGVHDFFAGIDRELLPYNDGRDKLTPSERLFGFVSTTASGNKPVGTKHRAAYAGRVRFSVARLENFDAKDEDIFDARGAYDDGLTLLKILASPKPPSPNLYFKGKGNNETPIDKHCLSLRKHEPQGLKVYLHQPHTGDGPQAQPWRTKAPEENKKQKNAVKPIKPGVAFAFHLDFDNLTEREIELLAFALKPTESFRHKLGMGKPLGLGTVRIDPVALLLIDREQRYKKDKDLFTAPRWHRSAVGDWAQVPNAYETERVRCGQEKVDDLAKRAESYKAWAEVRWPKAVHALLLLGQSNHPGAPIKDANGQLVPVHTPLADGQDAGGASGEKETFKWFAINGDRRKRIGDQQQLPAIKRPAAVGGTDSLPRLLKNYPKPSR